MYSAELDADVLEPFSQRLAGVMCVTDNNEGYWKSPSNEAIQGITGAELSLTAKIDDAQSQVNLLNEKGILTVFNSYGSGWKVWGNRSSAWPTETDWETFICVRRTRISSTKASATLRHSSWTGPSTRRSSTRSWRA